MAFDYSKLKGKIVEKFGSQIMFSEAMDMSTRTMSLKLNGKRLWRQDEICKAIQLLELSDTDIQAYFFSQKVQRIELAIV
jgi:hypothetical protein